MDIGCSCVYDDADPCEVFESKTVKGRKEYECVECGDVIKKGEIHEYSKWLFEGDWDKARTCSVCVNIRKSVYCTGSYTVGELREVIIELFGIDYTKHIEEDDDDDDC